MPWKEVWHVLTTPGRELLGHAAAQKAAGALMMAVNLVDVGALFLLVGSLILVMLGAKKAGQITYWTLAIYVIFKLVMVCL